MTDATQTCSPTRRIAITLLPAPPPQTHTQTNKGTQKRVVPHKNKISLTWLKARCHQGRALSKVSKRETILYLFQRLVAYGSPWLVTSSLWGLIGFSSMCAKSPSSFYQDTGDCIYGLRG